MERWGLGPEDLHEMNPGLVMVRYSGFGQTGPYKDPARVRHHCRVHERIHRDDRLPGHAAGTSAGSAG